jgi:hypothetical protein
MFTHIKCPPNILKKFLYDVNLRYKNLIGFCQCHWRDLNLRYKNLRGFCECHWRDLNLRYKNLRGFCECHWRDLNLRYKNLTSFAQCHWWVHSMWQWALRLLLHGLCKKQEAHLLAFHSVGPVWEIKNLSCFARVVKAHEPGHYWNWRTPFAPTKESLLSVMPQSRGCTNHIRSLRVSREEV